MPELQFFLQLYYGAILYLWYILIDKVEERWRVEGGRVEMEYILLF